MEEMGETHDSLLKNAFDPLLSTPNVTFHQLFAQEKSHWESGKASSFDQLDSTAKTVHNKMCSDSSWDDIDPKYDKIIAFTAEVMMREKKL